ncbi:MAG TPA: alpha/beta fold hydrolase [Caulobacteraceae bacterium]|nr:alpha/beta fold hydrolase [Caulobacteraceae bacterium]
MGSTETSDHHVNWRSLLAYVRALDDFTRAGGALLNPSSFERINAASVVAMPPVQTFEASDHGALAYRVYPARASRQVMVMIHGSGGFGDQMAVMADRLARANVATVYTPDIRGHGRSPGPRGHAVRHPRQLVDDLIAFMGHVRAAHPDAKISLAGHSAGGGLALGFARTAEAEDLVDSYVFLAPFLGLGCAANRPFFGGWVGLRAMTLRALTLANLFGVERFNDTTVVEFDTRGAAGDAYADSWSYNTMLAFGPGRWLPDARPLSSDKPVLVLAGTRDECFDASLYADAFAVAAPHADIRTLGPIGHWDLLVDDQTTLQMADWLARQALDDLVRLAPSAPEQRLQQQQYAAKRLREAS